MLTLFIYSKQAISQTVNIIFFDKTIDCKS